MFPLFTMIPKSDGLAQKELGDIAAGDTILEVANAVPFL